MVDPSNVNKRGQVTAAIDTMLENGDDIEEIFSKSGAKTKQVIYNRRWKRKEARNQDLRALPEGRVIQVSEGIIEAKPGYGIESPTSVSQRLTVIGALDRGMISQIFASMREGLKDIDIAIKYGLIWSEVQALREQYLIMMHNPALAAEYGDLRYAVARAKEEHMNLVNANQAQIQINEHLKNEAEWLRKCNDQVTSIIDANKRFIEQTDNEVKHIALRRVEEQTKLDDIHAAIALVYTGDGFIRLDSFITHRVRQTLRMDLSFWKIPFWSTILTLIDNHGVTKDLLQLGNTAKLERTVTDPTVLNNLQPIMEQWKEKVVRIESGEALRELLIYFVEHRRSLPPEIPDMINRIYPRRLIEQ